jgi:hypothetical protein
MTVGHWIVIHWFELSALLLLCLNLWYLISVLNTLRETNSWFSILASHLASKQTGEKGKIDSGNST